MSDFLPFRKSASRIWGGGKSAGRFSGCHQICLSGNILTVHWGRVNILADLVTGHQICQLQEILLADNWGWVNLLHRFSDYHQICQSGNLLAEMGKG